MADIMLHTSTNTGFTCVSNTFIDDFMKDANGEYVKIYLYLLRCLNRDDYVFSISQLADCLDHTEKDVMRALTYWEKVGVLHLEYSPENELSGIYFTDVIGNGKASSPVISKVTSADTNTTVRFSGASTVATEAGAPATIQKVSLPTYSPDQLKVFSEETAVQDLLFAIQTYLGKPLGQKEINTLLYWYDGLHMPIELIQYMVETNIGKGHRSFDYMNTIALSWADKGITTVEAARDESKSRNKAVYTIKKAFGIGNRELIPEELDYIEKWTTGLGMNLDFICDACRRTISQINKVSFDYADTIIQSWHAADVQTFDDIARLDEAHKSSSIAKISDEARAKRAASNGTANKAKANSKFHNFSQRSYDFDELEKKLLGN